MDRAASARADDNDCFCLPSERPHRTRSTAANPMPQNHLSWKLPRMIHNAVACHVPLIPRNQATSPILSNIRQYRLMISRDDNLQSGDRATHGPGAMIGVTEGEKMMERDMTSTNGAATTKVDNDKRKMTKLPQPISESTTDKIAEAITQGIRSGVFVPGQHLLEPDLTRRLGISRGSLREALKHLAAAGIVTLNRYRGAYIGLLDRKSVLDLLDTLEPLARLAARLAANNCGSSAKKRLMQDAANKIEAVGHSGNRAQYLELRRHFYDTMIALGGNRELARVMPLSRTDLFRAQVETVQSDAQRQRHVSGYGRIAQAIIAQDADAADRAVKRHFDGTRKTMQELPESSFPPAED